MARIEGKKRGKAKTLPWEVAAAAAGILLSACSFSSLFSPVAATHRVACVSFVINAVHGARFSVVVVAYDALVVRGLVVPGVQRQGLVVSARLDARARTAFRLAPERRRLWWPTAILHRHAGSGASQARDLQHVPQHEDQDGGPRSRDGRAGRVPVPSGRRTRRHTLGDAHSLPRGPILYRWYAATHPRTSQPASHATIAITTRCGSKHCYDAILAFCAL